jgi:Fe-S-cluster-containing dehydrogenase component
MTRLRHFSPVPAPHLARNRVAPPDEDGTLLERSLGPVTSRRDFLAFLAALGAGASLAACRRPEETIVPYVRAPESETLGLPMHYATTLTQLGTAFGVIVESHESRPTKIEGNPKHPESLGATSTFLQAALFDLYDPDRSREPKERGKSRTWAQASEMLSSLGRQLRLTSGADFAVLVDTHRSPTLDLALGALRAMAPALKIVRYAPLDPVEAREGARVAFGQPYESLQDWDQAERILVLDGDPLGLERSPLRAARGWAMLRVRDDGDSNRLYVIESSLSLTGSVADHRYSCASRDIGCLLCRLLVILAERQHWTLDATLLEELRRHGAKSIGERWSQRLEVIASDLAAFQGRSLVLAGCRQPPSVHALTHLLNYHLGNTGRTECFYPPWSTDPAGPFALHQLAADLCSAKVRKLVILGGNPVFTAPGDVDFASAIASAELTVHLGTHFDETARLCQWHLNLAHELESWGDAVARDGTASLVQPLVAPLWGGKAACEVLRYLVDEPQSAYELVRSTWKARFPNGDFEAQWRRALLDGIIDLPSGSAIHLKPDESAIAASLARETLREPSEYELVVVPSASVLDGQFANNGWLQELPDPLTKVTWGNPALISEHLAHRLELHDGDLTTITVGTRQIAMPVLIAPGQADYTVTVSVGQGHASLGRNANGIGSDTYPLRSVADPWIRSIARLEGTGSSVALARSQTHFHDEGRAPIREILRGCSPGSAEQSPPTPPAPVSTLAGPQRGTSAIVQAWAMAIDLAKCTGCGACIVACQAENNSPQVGRDEFLRGRDMHWLRVDRYYRTENGSVRAFVQPVPCQQCQNAPCEAVCPVGATAHSPEGLNDMAYNRCVGSRYCANNCPFKVRKFNYLEYNGQLTDSEKLRMNPDVSVRSRGVMEKCTFCVQRINRAKVEAKKNGSGRIPDGAIATACEQACPTRAITFGDLAAPQSRVSTVCRSTRVYRLLDALGVEPRVHYLACVRNPHPEL